MDKQKKFLGKTMSVSQFGSLVDKMLKGLSKKDIFISTPIFLYIKWVGVLVLWLFLANLFGTIKLESNYSDTWFFSILFLFITPFVIYLFIRCFKTSHLYSPRRKAFFASRLYQLASVIVGHEKHVVVEQYGKRKYLAISSETTNNTKFIASYRMNLLINQGGIILGGPAKIPTKLSEKTFYFLLECNSVFPDSFIEFDCRNRKVPLVSFSSNITSSDREINQNELIKNLQEILKGTAVKGEAEIKENKLKCSLFDTVKSIDPVSGRVLFKKISAKKKSPEAEAAIVNVADLVELLSTGKILGGLRT